ncbi:unnamed protein product [Calypogeia fissa]
MSREESVKRLEGAHEVAKSALELELEESRIVREKEREVLDQLRVDLNARVSEVTVREEVRILQDTPQSNPDTPGSGRRYNLRRSTLISTKTTQAASGASSDRKRSGLHEERSQRRKNTPPSIPEAAGELRRFRHPHLFQWL